MRSIYNPPLIRRQGCKSLRVNAFDVNFWLCCSEHDMAVDAHLVEDNVENQNESFSNMRSKQSSAKAASQDNLALASQETRGQRKRGGPAAGRGIKKIKTAGNQARRARSQIAKKRAKISEYESDESDSLEKIPYEQEADIKEGISGFPKEQLEPHESEKTHNIQGTEGVEISEQNKGHELEDFNDNQHENMLAAEIGIDDVCNEKSSHVSEKFEIMTDPVQAMLLDMIPSLATNKVEQPTNRRVEEEKRPETSNKEPSTSTKKKVSFKAMAANLLKDW